MSPEDIALLDEANVSPIVADLLAEGRKTIQAREHEYRFKETARANCRSKLIAANTMTAVAQLMRLCPKVSRLVPFIVPQDDADSDRPPADFRGMTLILKVPGFNPVKVTVGLTGSLSATPNEWELATWQVEKNGTWNAYQTLGEALAHGREDWLRVNRDLKDVPF